MLSDFEQARAQYIQRLPAHDALPWTDFIQHLENVTERLASRRSSRPSTNADRVIHDMATGAFPVKLLAISDRERSIFKLLPVLYNRRQIPDHTHHTLAYAHAGSVAGMTVDIAKDPPDDQYPPSSWILIHRDSHIDDELPMMVVRPTRSLSFSPAINAMILQASHELTKHPMYRPTSRVML